MAIEFNQYERTLFLPLIARASESKKTNSIFSDLYSEKILKQISVEIKLEEVSEYSKISWAARALQISKIISEVISTNPEINIVNIGAGLDTTFYIVDNGKIFWMNIDSKAVNDLRSQLLPNNDRVINIDGNILDKELYRLIKKSNKPLIVASGLFLYFSEQEIKNILLLLTVHFTSLFVVFDRISTYSIQYIKDDMNKNNMDGSIIKWGIDNVFEIETWGKGYKIVKDKPWFENIDRSKIENKEIVKTMDLNDQYNGSSIVLLEINTI